MRLLLLAGVLVLAGCGESTSDRERAELAAREIAGAYGDTVEALRRLQDDVWEMQLRANGGDPECYTIHLDEYPGGDWAAAVSCER